ncbi:hypothetical protein TNCV_4508471 [Trichonephila clavipes]|nr:hypothetical protein TNCV_4508471 [Trichonephila clavipes]
MPGSNPRPTNCDPTATNMNVFVWYPPFTQECTRGIPILLHEGKLSQMGRGGLMVGKGTKQQKIFLELGVFAMSLETLP